MQRIISIVGPTASGKTTLALWLAGQLSTQFSQVDLISADSRQVYRGMEIGTGADVPADFVRVDDADLPFSFWQNGKICIHGLSLKLPNEEWSVTHFRDLARMVIKKSLAQNGVPILVGGTGLYQEVVFVDDRKLDVKPDKRLRRKAEEMNVADLQTLLRKIDAAQFSRMNNSDQHNPRRLIRKIEIAQQRGLIPTPQNSFAENARFTIGLHDSIDHIRTKIEERIQQRLRHGMIDEVEKLIADYSETEWNLPAFSATGYKEIRAFLAEKISRDEMIALWLRREVQYAKRQMTWWKKQKTIHWIEVTEKDWQNQAYRDLLDS